jgi:hypothetical protein
MMSMLYCPSYVTQSLLSSSFVIFPLPLAVYGNVSDNSGTGVCFTRNPATGEKALFGEYLSNAQVGINMAW